MKFLAEGQRVLSGLTPTGRDAIHQYLSDVSSTLYNSCLTTCEVSLKNDNHVISRLSLPRSVTIRARFSTSSARLRASEQLQSTGNHEHSDQPEDCAADVLHTIIAPRLAGASEQLDHTEDCAGHEQPRGGIPHDVGRCVVTDKSVAQPATEKKQQEEAQETARQPVEQALAVWQLGSFLPLTVGYAQTEWRLGLPARPTLSGVALRRSRGAFVQVTRDLGASVAGHSQTTRYQQ